MNKSIIISTWLALAIAGCSTIDGVPTAKNFDQDSQYKLKSASHWRVVADDLSSQIVEDSKAQRLAVFINDPLPGASTFERVFTAQLKSSLNQNKVELSDSPINALILSFNLEQVKHIFVDQYRPGTFLTLATGVLVASQGFTYIDRAITSAGALDAATMVYSFNTPPSTEVVISLKLVNQERVISHKTQVYYVDDVDNNLFTNVQNNKSIANQNNSKVFNLVDSSKK